MNIENVKRVATVTVSAAIVGLSVASYIKTHRREVAKREEIQRNYELNIQAIRNASERAEMRMENGLYDNLSLAQIMEAYENDIEFQKIIIRMK